MRIIDTMRKADAVYWPVIKNELGGIISDANGNPRFDIARQIKVYWMQSSELLDVGGGQAKMSKGRVYTGEDIDEGGMMFLGTLDDVPPGRIDSPREIQKASQVIRFDKVATIKGDQWVRVAYV